MKGAVLGRIRVLIADDNAIVRVDLPKLLDLEGDMEVVGVAGDGKEAVELFDRLKPDVTVMDITMPRVDGIKATRQITSENPDAKVVMLSIHDTQKYKDESLKAGARAYLIKSTLFEELTETIRRISKEEYRSASL